MAFRRNRIRLLVANLLSIVGILVLIEATIRLLGPEIRAPGTDSHLMADSLYGASPGLQPNASGRSNGALFEIDEHGFIEYTPGFNPARPSWLFLGDSVTMGMGVDPDSSFAGRTAVRIDSLNVLNPSVIGYALDDYARIFGALIPGDGKSVRFDIRRVTLFLCLNDVYAEAVGDVDPGNRVRRVGGRLLDVLRRHYRTYHVLKAMFFDRPRSYYEFAARYVDENPEALEKAIRTVREMARKAAEAKIRFDVVSLPYEYQLRAGASKASTSLQDVLAARLEDLMTVHDPRHHLIASVNSPKDLYLYGDGIHFSRLGHARLASFIADSLAR